MSRINEIISAITKIPPFPKVAQKVMQMIADPDVSTRDLATVIKYDPSVTANVLKICNSAYFGLNRKISSLDEGLIYIGHDILKDIIITSSSSGFYKGQTGNGYQLDEGELWKHSVAAGIMAKLLVRHVKGVESGAAYTAALLHDIGKLILSRYVEDEFQKIFFKVTKENYSFVEAEKECLGITHAELGGLILKQWEFSDDLVQAVAAHHDPDALRKAPLTALVSLGNILVISLGIGVGADGLATKLQGEVLRTFGISNTDLDFLMADLIGEMEKAKELLQMLEE